MCDYSLHAVAGRPAQVAETLVSSKFQTPTTRGFARPDDPQVAVCLRPDRIREKRTNNRLLLRKDVGDRLARFRQIDLDQPMHHHDALKFSNGALVLVTDLIPGQRARVLQLPANPVEQKAGVPRSSARQDIAGPV
jgi:hypothetical protein